MRRTMILALLLLLLLLRCEAQVGRKDNVKYLRCAVCEEIAQQLYSQITDKQQQQQQQASRKKVSEVEIIELVEKLCDVKKKESEWMFFLDIVREGGKLTLVRQPEEGECNTRCKTIQRTCKDVIGEHDTDIGEFISTHLDQLSVEAISKSLCKDLTNSCINQPVAPKNLDLGEPFTPKPSKDADISRLMRSMGDMPGAPGMKMYSKDDLMNMRSFGGDEENDDDDDDDEESSEIKFKSLLSKNPPGNLNKAVARKKSVTEIIRSVTKQVVDSVHDTIHSTRRSLHRAVKAIRRWRRNRMQKNLKAEL